VSTHDRCKTLLQNVIGVKCRIYVALSNALICFHMVTLGVTVDRLKEEIRWKLNRITSKEKDDGRSSQLYFAVI
jgi:hypothetical protein